MAVSTSFGHQLHRHRENSGLEHVSPCCDRFLNGPESREQRAGRLRQGEQLEGDARDHPQSPFGAHHQPGQVQADHVLVAPATGPYDLPAGQDDLEAEDILSGHPVLDRAHAPRIGGHIAADGREPDTGRVRRVEEVLPCRFGLKMGGDHSGLDLGESV
jgi:hypothetical protein